MASKKQSPIETIGDRIRALRLAANLTQDEFAAKLNVSRSAIAQWETDRAGQVRDNKIGRASCRERVCMLV